jgi:NADH-quinone oxidoreductase subunit K
MIVNQFLVLAAGLFSFGVYGLLVRRNIVLILLSVVDVVYAVKSALCAGAGWVNSAEALGAVVGRFVVGGGAAGVGGGRAGGGVLWR